MPADRSRLVTRFLLALLATTQAAFGLGVPAKPLLPEDLGPAQIDVSGYPDEYQQTYRKVFVPFFTRFGGTARMVNSPLVTGADWKTEIEKIRMRPPCCASCPYLSMKDARRLYKFMVYDSARRKTGASAAGWQVLRRGLVERFNRERKGEMQ